MAMDRMQMISRLSTEFVGTFFLCMTVALATAWRGAASPIAPVAIGFVLMVLVYAGGHVSGAHYNPAVTMAIFVRNKICPFDACLYVASQMGGGLLGSLVAWPLIGKAAAGHPVLGAGVSTGAALAAELVVTFALCSVVLHTATTRVQANNSYYGLAIGATVLSGAVSVGGLSGGAFNPAVGLTTLLYRPEASVWVYFVGPLLAGALAGFVFRFVAQEEFGARPDEQTVLAMQCATELIGTMVLCFTVGTAAAGASLLTPLAIGSALMVMVYMGGATSGAHFNPAVTLAILVRSRLHPTQDYFCLHRAGLYVASQVLGAALGAFAAKATLDGGSVGHPSLPASSTLAQGLLAEMLGTFLLAGVVLNVATVRALAGNSFFGLAIGMTVTSMACALGPISGGAFNPAVGLIGPVTGEPVDAWIYWVAPPVGAVLAALAFRLQNETEFMARAISTVKFMAHVDEHQPRRRYMLHAPEDSTAVARTRSKDDGNAQGSD